MSSSPGAQRSRVEITNKQGQKLAALLEQPPEDPRAVALFAHCFTCSKDIAAAARISRELARLGFAVLRFDFTGIGHSEGEFANTNFSSNVDDLVSVADHLREHLEAPVLLIGHSLGGAAVLAAASAIPECRAVATIGAPSDPSHVKHLFGAATETIEREGTAIVELAGRPFEVQRQFLDDISNQNMKPHIRGLKRALLVMHSPVDTTVSIDNASEIFLAAMHPKSFVSLDNADHLLTRRADAEYVAATIGAWASRFVPPLAPQAEPVPAHASLSAGEVEVRERDHKFLVSVTTNSHRWVADEPTSVGGTDLGPSPYDQLLSALGTCTVMTIRLYANRKKLPLDDVRVRLAHDRIHAEDCEHCDTREGRIDRIRRWISLDGDLDEEARQRLLEIADRCPVHRTLHGEILVETALSNT